MAITDFGFKIVERLLAQNVSMEAIEINTIGTNIKRLRKIHNLNQTDFANNIGVSQGSHSS
jgi:DNA-binding XRE family transcriptional regulator